MNTVSPKELVSLLDKNPENIELIDVRGKGEYDEVHIAEAKLIPLHLLPLKMNEVNAQKQVIFICRSGGRSGQACQFAEKSGIQAYNLSGGMSAFELDFPLRVVHGEKKK